MIKLFLCGYNNIVVINFVFQKIKFYKFHYISFCFINLFYILDLLSKMPMKVRFIKKGFIARYKQTTKKKEKRKKEKKNIERV